jgi:hypothetical protein
MLKQRGLPKTLHAGASGAGNASCESDLSRRAAPDFPQHCEHPGRRGGEGLPGIRAFLRRLPRREGLSRELSRFLLA